MAMQLPECQHIVLAQDVGLCFCLSTFTYTPSLQLAWVPCQKPSFFLGLEAVLTMVCSTWAIKEQELLITIC